MNNPLVTFVVLGYCQEQFIREAVEGAFSQDYSPLEIILTDDCSPDRTFEIMQEMAASYNGPHTITLDRPSSNVGLSAQLDRIVRIAKGEWIVVGAGDDISLPHRVTKHMEIASLNLDAFSIFLSPSPFGESPGRWSHRPVNKLVRYPESVWQYGGGTLGATHGFRKSAWNTFGNLGAGIICEDWVIPFRSSLLGTVVQSEHVGVRYRTHGNSITDRFWNMTGSKEKQARQLQMESQAYDSFSRDLKTALLKGLVSHEQAQFGFDRIAKVLRSNEAMLRCVRARGFGSWVSSALQLLFCRDFVGNYRRKIHFLFQTLRRQPTN